MSLEKYQKLEKAFGKALGKHEEFLIKTFTQGSMKNKAQLVK